MSRFFISCICCSRRVLDSGRVRNYLTMNGMVEVDSPEKADYLFIFTCGLTKWIEDKCIEEILRLRKFNGELIVCGCLPSMNMERIKSVFNGKMISTRELDKLDDIFPDFSVKFRDAPDANKTFIVKQHRKTNFIKEKLKKIDPFYLFKISNMLIVIVEKFIRSINKLVPLFPKTTFKKYIRYTVYRDSNFFTLRISLGCLGNCSFCNIKKAIGKLKSKPISLILEELRKGLSDKQYKINIVASDSGSYGLDIGSNLPQLLNAILNEDERITIEFIEDLHPAWICRYKSELIKLIKTKRIKNIFTAIQSGSGRILKLMNRHVDLNEFKAVIKEMKKVNPRLRLRTQVIVGFPAETEQDLQETINFLKECKFDEVDVFYYFETSTMDSAKIKPKVPQEVMVDRGKRIRSRLPAYISIHYY